jgi:hypothetical protein
VLYFTSVNGKLRLDELFVMMGLEAAMGEDFGLLCVGRTTLLPARAAILPVQLASIVGFADEQIDNRRPRSRSY